MATSDDIVLVAVVVTGLGFDFTNGFHDTANAMATSIATGALKPRVAVILSGCLNFVGAFLSLAVATVIAKGIVNPDVVTLNVVFAGLVGGIAWNLITWLLGIPSSSSYALIGGVIGATLIADGRKAIDGTAVISKVFAPMVFAPILAGIVALLGTYVVFKVTNRVPKWTREDGFRVGQIATASLVSLAHGTNDAQKTMGVITLALIVNHTIPSSATTPTWVIVLCALAISLGTFFGGWRIIRTMGKGLTDIVPPQGFAAEAASASVILASSHFGYPLSTTQVTTGSVMGSGIGRRLAEVRWSVFWRIAAAWVITIPAAAIVGGIAWRLAEAIGGNAGVAVVMGLTIVFAAAMYLLSRRSPINPKNVNEEWTGGLTPADEAHAASVKAA